MTDVRFELTPFQTRVLKDVGSLIWRLRPLGQSVCFLPAHRVHFLLYNIGLNKTLSPCAAFPLQALDGLKGLFMMLLTRFTTLFGSIMDRASHMPLNSAMLASGWGSLFWKLTKIPG